MSTLKDFFTPLENDQPFIKMSFEGFGGSGKSYTAALNAIGLHKHINSKTPIVWVITEPGIKRLKWLFDEAGIEVLIKESKSLADWVQAVRLCEEHNIDIMVTDSITHYWDRYTEDYCRQMNRTRLQFQDWGIIKPKWRKEFSDIFVEAKVNILITGRLSFDYDYEIINGRKELVKSGTKMRTEKETAYEPDIIVQMERVEKEYLHGQKLPKPVTEHWAYIKKDRSTKIHGQRFLNPTFDNFLPAVAVIMDGTKQRKVVNEAVNQFPNPDRTGDFIDRINIALDGIKGAMALMQIPSTTKGKAFKVEVLQSVFKSKSWKAIEKMPVETLEMGNNVLNVYSDWYKKEAKEAEDNGGELDYETALQYLKNQSMVEATQELPFD